MGLTDEDYADDEVMGRIMRQRAVRLLEESQVQWRRDFDAVALGFVLGVLATLAVQGVW